MKLRILLAIAGDPRRPVGQVPLVLLLADRQAEVGALVQTVDALPALRREEGDDVIARGERADIGADRLDHPGPLVPQHGRRVAGGVGAGGGVEVGVADPAGMQANQHLARPRLGQLDLLHRQWLSEFLQHRGAHLHRVRLLPQSMTVSTTATLARIAQGVAGWFATAS
jgi:hypothetical protein